MSEVKPLVILPFDMSNDQTGEGLGEENIRISSSVRPIDKITRIIKIALKLAKNDAFDDDLHIKNESGDYNRNSNVAQLLNITQTRIRNIAGMSELIRHMHLAKIDPSYIINEFVRSRLEQLLGSNPSDPPNPGGNIGSPTPPNEQLQDSLMEDSHESPTIPQPQASDATTQTEIPDKEIPSVNLQNEPNLKEFRDISTQNEDEIQSRPVPHRRKSIPRRISPVSSPTRPSTPVETSYPFLPGQASTSRSRSPNKFIKRKTKNERNKKLYAMKTKRARSESPTDIIYDSNKRPKTNLSHLDDMNANLEDLKKQADSKVWQIPFDSDDDDEL